LYFRRHPLGSSRTRPHRPPERHLREIQEALEVAHPPVKRKIRTLFTDYRFGFNVDFFIMLKQHYLYRIIMLM